MFHLLIIDPDDSIYSNSFLKRKLSPPLKWYTHQFAGSLLWTRVGREEEEALFLACLGADGNQWDPQWWSFLGKGTTGEQKGPNYTKKSEYGCPQGCDVRHTAQKLEQNPESPKTQDPKLSFRIFTFLKLPIISRPIFTVSFQKQKFQFLEGKVPDW